MTRTKEIDMIKRKDEMHDKRRSEMSAYHTIMQRITEMRRSYENTKEKIKYDEMPDFTNLSTLAEQKNRSVRDDFSTLLILYGKDGVEWSVRPFGNWRMKMECPRTGFFHKHAYVEILYVIEGSFEQILLGEKMHFEQGEFVITDQNCEHADYIEAEDAAVLFLQIQAEYLERLLRSYDGTDEMQKFLFHALWSQKREQSFLELRKTENGEEEELGHILELLVAEDLGRQAGYQQIEMGLLIRLLQYMCRNYTPQLHSDSREGREKAFLYELEYYIRLHAATVTTEELEQRFHYHRNYYSLLLKKYRGKSFRQYVQEVRMKYARQLLEQTTEPIKEIAHKTGYENISHFYHLFEKMFGMTPKEIREK